MSVQHLEVNQLSNPADREKLLKIIKLCSDEMYLIEGHRAVIKEEIAAVCEDLQIPKKLVNRMVKVYHKQNYDEEVAVHEQFETLYETIVK